MGKTCFFKSSNTGRRHDPNIVSGVVHAAPAPAPGPAPVGLPALLFAEDAEAAAAVVGGADTVAIVFVATSSAEGSDRRTLAYAPEDDKLVAAVAAVQPNTIVVAVTPGAVLMPWSDNVAAILMPFMPGQMFGDAITNLVFGDVSPSGRLPLTMPNTDNEMGWGAEQWPGVQGNVTYSEKLLVGYRWYDQNGVTPKFPFGHGLTYSGFNYGAATAEPPSSAGTGASNGSVAFVLTNNGTVAAAEVAQLFPSYPVPAGEPLRVLRGFSKVWLAAGASTTVSFPLTRRDVNVAPRLM